MRFSRWVSTVRGLMPSRVAISASAGALGGQLEDFPLPGGECFVQIWRGVLRLLGVGLDGALGQGRTQIAAAGIHFADGLKHFGGIGIFEDVAHGAIPQGLPDVGLVGVHGKDDDPRLEAALRRSAA